MLLSQLCYRSNLTKRDMIPLRSFLISSLDLLASKMLWTIKSGELSVSLDTSAAH